VKVRKRKRDLRNENTALLLKLGKSRRNQSTSRGKKFCAEWSLAPYGVPTEGGGGVKRTQNITAMYKKDGKRGQKDWGKGGKQQPG